jgi:N,N'-diacetyllegionaminate synthase
MGASVIEKHFTLDRHLPGPDHRASLEPQELSDMISCIRNIERALGTGYKKPSPSELKNKPIVRKSIVAAKVIKKGQLFDENNLGVKRVGRSGINPMRWNELIGQPANRNYSVDEIIEI